MRRVAAQGDLRPMAASREAMDDLKSILASRVDLYARADLAFDTGGLSLGEAFLRLRDRVSSAVGALTPQPPLQLRAEGERGDR